MVLRHIALTNYNNYSTESVTFNSNVNALNGKNGMGKTNMLDAIYYLCIGKSYFSTGDKYVVKKGEDFFRLEGTFGSKEIRQIVEIKVQPGDKKEIILSGKKREKLSDHIGAFPCVIIAPVDIELMLAGSEERRKFLNNTVMQFDRKYVDNILIYNRQLKQRNALLKTFADKHYYDQGLVDAISSQMYAPASYVHKVRAELIEAIKPVFKKYYALISDESEACDLNYKSDLNKKSLAECFAESKEKDKVLTRTCAGVHKDDLILSINGEPLKNFASQGQLKSIIIALKLAQYEMLSTHNASLPILLLDDIFDKLDRSRVEHLLKIISGKEFGQVFISDTNSNRVPELLKKISVEYSAYHVENGKIEKE